MLFLHYSIGLPCAAISASLHYNIGSEAKLQCLLSPLVLIFLPEKFWIPTFSPPVLLPFEMRYTRIHGSLLVGSQPTGQITARAPSGQPGFFCHRLAKVQGQAQAWSSQDNVRSYFHVCFLSCTSRPHGQHTSEAALMQLLWFRCQMEMCAWRKSL